MQGEDGQRGDIKLRTITVILVKILKLKRLLIIQIDPECFVALQIVMKYPVVKVETTVLALSSSLKEKLNELYKFI